MTKTKPTLRKRKESTPSFLKKRIKKTSSKLTQKERFRKYLAKIESPDYPWVAKGCPENATALEKMKYDTCQSILSYKLTNHLTTQQIARKIHLNKDETQKLLFC